ncbi:hypothetical protein SNL152K_3765 [Streptomyces sp. NL15-2K]|nr:hypothetical protein SNL152K_3765 [Streptomyces sp. NL15-2K]
MVRHILRDIHWAVPFGQLHGQPPSLDRVRHGSPSVTVGDHRRSCGCRARLPCGSGTVPSVSAEHVLQADFDLWIAHKMHHVQPCAHG